MRFSIQNIIVGLFGIDILFIVMHFLIDSPIFNLDIEFNLPTSYQSLKLLITGIAAMLIGFRLWANGSPSRKLIYWFVFAAGFIFLAADEFFQIHENLAFNLKTNFASWVIPYLPIVLFGLYFGAKMLNYLRQITDKHTRAIFIAGIVCFVFVPVLEVIGTWNWRLDTDLYQVIVAIEEGMEMFGASFFLTFIFLILKVNRQKNK